MHIMVDENGEDEEVEFVEFGRKFWANKWLKLVNQNGHSMYSVILIQKL